MKSLSETGSAWSVHNPDLRIAWDATALSDFMFCPRKYDYIHNKGYGGSKVDFEFGGMAASAFERFQKARVAGSSRDDAALVALRYAFEASWNYETDTPWGGRYEDQWHCLGQTKYHNSKGNAAKCPYSHKGAWFPPEAPDICGECGSAVETERHYIPNDNYKNRETLLRLITWYCLEQPEDLEDGLHAYKFPDGTAAVELSFAIPMPFKNRYGEQYILAGHLDQIGVFGAENWIVDQKSTKKSLNDTYFKTFTPHVQFDTYDLVGNLLFPDLDIQGVLVDAAQTLIGGAKFARFPYRKTESQRQEHLDTIEFWIKLAEDVAERYKGRDYPMNKDNCWHCPFRKICTLDKSERQGYLNSEFERRERWNPLEAR